MTHSHTSSFIVLAGSPSMPTAVALRASSLAALAPGSLFYRDGQAGRWAIRATLDDAPLAVVLDDGRVRAAVQYDADVTVLAVEAPWHIVPAADGLALNAAPVAGALRFADGRADLLAVHPDDRSLLLAIDLSTFQARPAPASAGPAASRWHLIVPSADPTRPWLDLTVG